MGFQKSVPSLRAQISATIAQHPTKRRTGRRTVRAIGLVLLSIAIMALLLTDADAKRRSSAQGSQARGPAEAGARPIPGKASTTTAVLPRNNGVWPRCGGSVAFADLIRFPGRRMGAATPGQVRSARAAAGLTDRRARTQQEGVSNEDASCCRHSCDGD